MKKTLFILICLAAGLLSCTEEMTSPEEASQGSVPMTFHVTVLETKAAKTAWADGDKIYVFFKDLGTKYLILEHSDGSWTNSSGGGTLMSTDFSGLGIKKLTAVHFPMAVDVAYADGKFSFISGGKPVYHYYLFETGKDYSVSGTTVTATLSLGKPANLVQFHVEGIQDNVSDYTFSCPKIKPVACESVGTDGTIAEDVLQDGARLKGIADADGGVFAGRITTTESADYQFKLAGGDKVYTLTRTGKTLTAGNRYNFPALTETGGANWSVEDATELYVDLGMSVKWAKVNVGNTPFIGMEDVHILTYNLEYDNAAHGHFFYTPVWGGETVTATRDYDLGTLHPAKAEDNASLSVELALPLGTNAVMLYGKAHKSNSNDLQGGSLAFSLSPRLGSLAAFEAGTFFFSRMLNYFISAGLVNGAEDRSFGFWWPAPTEADKSNLPVNPVDGTTKTIGTVNYHYYQGQLSWKQLGGMYEHKYEAKTTNNTPIALSALGEVLGAAYNQLVPVQNSWGIKVPRAGGAQELLHTMQDLYSLVKRVVDCTPTNWEEQVARLLGEQIRDRMEEFMKVTSSGFSFLQKDGTVDVGTLKSSLERHCSLTDWDTYKSIIDQYLDASYFPGNGIEGFPVNLGIPIGGAFLTSNANPSFQSVDTFEYATDTPANYRYPAELMYFGNSAIRTHSSVIRDYPSSIVAWDNEEEWSGWESKSTVRSDTRSVAMINNINYGTALLASTVKFGSNTLKDNNSALHPGESDQKWTVTNNGLAVTGILVGGQAEQMGWNFVRYPSTDNDFDKTIYDKLTSAYWVGNTTEPIYTLVWDNYDATKAADHQSDVYVGVELVNKTGKDFWGRDHFIRNGSTFYLLGKLDLSSARATAEAEGFVSLDRSYYCYPPFDPANGNTINAWRVFMQDYMTMVNLIITENSLKYAYVTMPDLRASQISLGVSIDMKWMPCPAIEILPYGLRQKP